MHVDVGFRPALSAVQNSTQFPGLVWGQQLSHLSQLIRNSWVSVAGVDHRLAFGVGGDPNPDPTLTVSRRLDEPEYDGIVDWQRYAWSLGELLHRGLTGTQTIGSSFENEVRHTILRGAVRPKGCSFYSGYNEIKNLGDYLAQVNDQLLDPSFPRFWCANLSAPFGKYYEGQLRDTWGDMQTLLDLYTRNPPAENKLSFQEQTWYGYGSVWDNPSSLRYKFSNDEVFVTYKFLQSSATRRYITTRTIRFTVKPFVNSTLYSGYGDNVTFRIKGAITDVIENFTLLGGDYVFVAPTFSNRRVTTIDKLVAKNLTFVLTRPYNTEGVNETLIKRREVLDSLIGQLGPSFRTGALISTNDAVDTTRTSFNFVESASEILSTGELVLGPAALAKTLQVTVQGEDAVVKDLRARFGRVRKVYRAPTRLGLAGWAFLLADVVSSLHLQTAFGIKPLIQDAKEVTKMSDRLISLGRQLESGFHARGSHRVGIPYQGLDLDVTIRTKMYIPPLIEADFRRLVELDASGLLSTPGRVYQASKYTFILDYLSKIGDRINALESYVWVCFARAAPFVHSYRITSLIDESFDFDDGYEFVEGSSSYTFYKREVSFYAPSPVRSTEINLLPPKGPSAATALALIFQFAKAAISQ